MDSSEAFKGPLVPKGFVLVALVLAYVSTTEKKIRRRVNEDGVLVHVNLQSMRETSRKRILLSPVRLAGLTEQQIDLEDWTQFERLVPG